MQKTRRMQKKDDRTLTTAFHARSCACGPPRSTDLHNHLTHTNFMYNLLNKFDSIECTDPEISAGGDASCCRDRKFRTRHSAFHTRLCHRAILRRSRRMKGRPPRVMGGLAAIWFVLFLCGL